MQETKGKGLYMSFGDVTHVGDKIGQIRDAQLPYAYG